MIFAIGSCCSDGISVPQDLPNAIDVRFLYTAINSCQANNISPLVPIECGQGVIYLRKAMPIFYSALLLTGVNLLLRLAGTSFQVFISAQVGAAGVGLLQLVLSVGSMSMTLGMAGVRTGTMYLTAEELGRNKPGNVRWILSGCFTYSILISMCVSIALTLLAPALAQYWIGDPQTTKALRLFALFVPVNCLCGVMVGYFTAANRIGTLAVVEIAEQLCSMLLTASLLIFWADHDPARSCEAVIMGSGMGSCLTLGCLMVLRILERTPAGKAIPVRSRLLQVAAPLALADDLKTGINTVENLMVPKRLALFAGAVSPLAAFGTVCGMVFPVLMFPAAILYGLAELLIPELARCAAAGSENRIRYLTRRSLRIAMLYGCLFSGLMYIAAEPLCQRLYSSELAGYWLKRYALLIPMLYCDAITDAMTKGLGQQKACVRYNILTSFMDVVLLYLLLPKYGMKGYFISFLVTHALNFGLSLRRLLIITGKKSRFAAPALTVIATVIATGICSVIPFAFLGCVVFPVTLICLLIMFNVVGKEDFIWLKSLIHPR